MSGIVTVFVQTPGFSPVKAGLHSLLGREQSEEFFNLSIESVKSVIDQACHDSTYATEACWVTTEPEGTLSSRWQNWNTIFSGHGNIAKRLHNVYSQLVDKHDFVLLMGYDSPHLSPKHVKNAMQYLMTNGEFIIGPASDGGFYLFGGTQPLPESFWHQIPMGEPDATQKMIQFLNGLNYRCTTFETVLDVSTPDDFQRLPLSMATNDYLPEQQKLKSWLLEKVAA